MKIVLDTNVFVSGVFFLGPPYEILDAWRTGKVGLVISAEILEEYLRTGEKLGRRAPGAKLEPWLELLAIRAILVDAPPLPEKVCSDPDDDMFLACAIASGARMVVSGDRALLKVSGYRGISILPPRDFVEKHLK